MKTHPIVRVDKLESEMLLREIPKIVTKIDFKK